MGCDYCVDIILTVPWLYKNNEAKYFKILLDGISVYNQNETSFKEAEKEYIEHYGINSKGTIMKYNFVSKHLNTILYYSFLKIYKKTKDVDMQKYIFDNFLLDINKLSFLDDNLKVNLHPYIGLIQIEAERDGYNTDCNIFENMIGNKFFDKIYREWLL